MIVMYALSHPLDWWVQGGYAEVARQTGWTLPYARRQVRKALKEHGWQPIGHAGYTALRESLMAGDHIDHELT